MSYARLTRFEETVDRAVWIKWAHPQREVFFAVVDAIRERIPPHARAYAATSKSWRIDAAYLHLLVDLLPELATATHARQEPPRKAAVPWRDPVAVPPEVEAALGLLYLLPGAPRPLVQQAYRALALRHHPDTGGTTEAMTDINRAYEVAQAWYSQRETPPTEAPHRSAPRRRKRGAAA
jgi:hypothetical protein